jgi:poly(A) polymerase
MLGRASRTRAIQLMAEHEVLSYLWPNAEWRPEQVRAAVLRLSRVPADATFELAFAALVSDREPREVQRVCRALKFSNPQRESVVWLVAHQADLDDPARPTLAELKRLLAHRDFASLRALAEGRYQDMAGAERRAAQLDERIASIAPAAIKPPPYITGDDLAARGVKPGPIYKQVLDQLYTRQLDEQIVSRAAALRELDALLAEHAGESRQ